MEGSGIAVDFAAQVGWPLVVVWAVLLPALGSGMRRGITEMSTIGIPLLFAMFIVLVGYLLTLDGAARACSMPSSQQPWKIWGREIRGSGAGDRWPHFGASRSVRPRPVATVQ